MSTATEGQATDTLVERFGLKTLVECCLLLEEGIAGTKDIETGMMMGAGILPGPFTRADERGLDEILEALERAEQEWGPAFKAPLILKRLVNQGRLGKKSGQGFFTYPQPDGDSSYETIALETRGDVGVLWLNRPPANPLSPDVIKELSDVWSKIDGQLRAVVVASSNIFTIAAVNSLAFGGGCELAMACDFRIAAESATFAQPEINLGIIPGFGGTQRLPRLVGEGKALEMNLRGDAIGAFEAARYGLVNQVVPDHELFDTALLWARKLGEKAPIAIEQIKSVSAMGELGEGLEAEAQGFAKAFGSEDAKEGISAFLGKRQAKVQGK